MKNIAKGVAATLLMSIVIGAQSAQNGRFSGSLWSSVYDDDEDTLSTEEYDSLLESRELTIPRELKSAIYESKVDSHQVYSYSLNDTLPDDSLAYLGYPKRRTSVVAARIPMLARSYGDSVVIRWAGEDFVTQRKLYKSGVTLIRYDHVTGEYDSIVHNFKPSSLEAMRAKYPESDSIAYMAMELLHGDNYLQSDQTRREPGTLGASMERNDDQQTHFAFSVLASEWRPDLANHLAMRAVDFTAIKGRKYDYILQPTSLDSIGNFSIGAGVVANLENKPFEGDDFKVAMGDSIVGPYAVRLWWENRNYSSYEIERRKDGEIEWTRINSHPYLMMATDERDKPIDCFYKDVVPEAGDYEYRVFGHDAFGDLTKASPVHKVHIPDLVGPNAPRILRIDISRRDTTDLTKGVFATFHIEKDSYEEDFEGFMPLYYHKKLTNNEWKRLSDKLLGPNDTVFTVDVTGLSTGMVSIGAYDKAGNASYSLPQMIRLQDLKAPDAPRNLKAVTDAEKGTITLTWDSDEDDIEYYEIASVNDLSHKWMLINQGKHTEKMFVDTVAMDVNQKYIYYKVRAIDYSTNEGAYSEVLKVVRPSILPPSSAHLESSSSQKDGIHMRWGVGTDQQIDYHLLLRRLESQGDEEWKIIARWDGDSISATGGYIDIVDQPDYIRDDRYVYAVRTVAINGMTTLSMALSMAWEGDMLFEWPIKLFGDYDANSKSTRLAWEMDDKLPYKGDWYFCIYRKRMKDEYHKFLISADPKERMHQNYLIRPGEQDEYYIFIQFKDGRKSTHSNIVTVKAPEKQ